MTAKISVVCESQIWYCRAEH